MMFDRIGLDITGLALILNIIGVAIPYWFKFSDSTFYFGLWQLCSGTTKGDVSSCENINGFWEYNVPVEFYAARALEILAILATTATIVVACLKIFSKKENTRLLYIATPISLLAGLLMIIGAIVFVVDNDLEKRYDSSEDHLKPHASFFLCIVSGFLSFVASSMFLIAARAISRQTENHNTGNIALGKPC